MGKVLLAIGNRQVSSETSLPLKIGQQLTLQVRSLGEQPVLKITTLPPESPLNSAIRLLLPRQSPMPPLLAMLGQLTRNPNHSLPTALSELVRSVVTRMPDIQTAASAQGLRKAVAESGVFLERQLLQQARQSPQSQFAHTDFKANLLRLIQLVRQWPADRGQAASQAPRSNPTATAPATPASPASTAQTAGASGVQTAAPAAPATTATAPQTRPASPDQLQRAIQASAGGRAVGAAAAPSGSSAGTPAAAGGTALSSANLPAATMAAPLRGALPVPHPAVQSSLEMLRSVVEFRADLLQQTEAALARIQLHQLAALPREGERGLLEWLFEIPVRRGEDIDLWSMRFFSEQRQQQENRQQPATWFVQLAFDLPGLGPVQAQVQLSGEQVSTRFWAEQQNTLPLLRAHLDELRRALNKVGLDVGELDCVPGPRPAEHSSSSQTLIQEKA
jgi:hypothetical protein